MEQRLNPSTVAPEDYRALAGLEFAQRAPRLKLRQG